MMELYIISLVFLFPRQTICDQKVYYVAAENVLWDYAPKGKNLVTDDQSFAKEYLEHKPEHNKQGHVYSKIIYQEYKDGSFSEKKESAKYLGYLGPVLKVNIGDELVVVFKNNATYDLSIHPHGLVYDKANEGSAYNGIGGVSPGNTHRYTWNITHDSALSETSCVSYLYHSDVKFSRDVNSGLVGYILVCSKDADVKQGEEDIFLFVGVMDENLSLMSKALNSTEATNMMHSINGFVYGNMPNLTVCLATKLRLHIASLSTSDDVHAVRFYGQTFTLNGKRYDVLPVYSGASLTAELVPSEPGIWLFTSTSKIHIEGGMQTMISIDECNHHRPVIDVSSKIRKYYISAEKIQWKGQNRSVFVGYTDRTFSVRISRNSSETYLGALGPLLKAQVGDVLKIVFYNKLNTTSSIRPWGLRTSKAYEGQTYKDKVTGKIETAPGEKRTYYWFVPEYTGPTVAEDVCIPRYYTSDLESTLIGPMVICQPYALDENDGQVVGGMDFFLFIMEFNGNGDMNGYDKNDFPETTVCPGYQYRIHVSTFGRLPVTLLSTGDPFNAYGSTVSSIGIVPFLPITVKYQPTREGKCEIVTFPDNTVGLSFYVSSCGNSSLKEEFSEDGDLTYLGITENRWAYDGGKISAMTWKEAQTGDSKMTSRYQKAVYIQYFQNLVIPDSSRRLPYQGYIGHVFYTSVGKTVKISLKNNAHRNFSIFTPGVISDFSGELSPDSNVNITWKIPQNVGPGSADPECIAKTYFSNLETQKDITTGLIGPIIVCSKGVDASSAFKHNIVFFGEVDETKSWYFKENVQKYGPKTKIDFKDPAFIDNNKIHVVNGMTNGTLPEIILEHGKPQFIHFFNIGFKFMTIHLAGLIFPMTNNNFVGRDIVALHPGTTYSLKVEPHISGKWKIEGYGTEPHWNKMSAIVNVPLSTGGS